MFAEHHGGPSVEPVGPRHADHPVRCNPGDQADGQVVNHIGGYTRYCDLLVDHTV